MPRPSRLVLADQPLHVIQRGNNRSLMFRTVVDYLYFKLLLAHAARRARCAIHAYVLMPNHVHLLVTPSDVYGPGRMMQSLGRAYVRYFNDRHERTGTLFEGRYRSALVESERYFFACSRYIELNPVRAGMVRHPEEYRWSSYAHNANGAGEALLTKHPLYLELAPEARDRRLAYASLFNERLGEDLLLTIRRSTNTGAVLGSAEFRGRVEEQLLAEAVTA